MEITFKYNGKIITTPNLEKKLKRMKLQLSDIEIIDNLIKKEKPLNSGIEDYMLNKRQVIVCSTEDNIRRVCFIDKNKGLPTIYELFKKNIWNPETKTGIKYLTPEFLMTMYYES
jgi:rRNA-processing protein FCF1